MEKKITKTDEKIEARDRTLKKMEELKKITLEALEGMEKKHKDGNKGCWFNLQKCLYCLEVKGFEDARRDCGNCSQLDIERFFAVAEYVFGNSKFIEDKESKAREEGREEGKKEATEEAEEKVEEECANIYDEISEELDGLWAEIEEKIK